MKKPSMNILCSFMIYSILMQGSALAQTPAPNYAVITSMNPNTNTGSDPTQYSESYRNFEKDFDALIDGAAIPKPGDTMNWAGGTLSRMNDGKISYTENGTSRWLSKGSFQSLGLMEGARQAIINQYGIDLGTSKDVPQAKGTSVSGNPFPSSTNSQTTAQTSAPASSRTYEQMEKDFNAAIDGSVVPKPGDSMKWAAGTLTRMNDGKLAYTEGNKTIWLAKGDLHLLVTMPGAKQALIDQYGHDPYTKQPVGTVASSTKPSTDATKNLVTKPAPINEKVYNKALFKFASVPFGMLEVGEKFCKPAGEGYTKSLVEFHAANKSFIEAQLERDKYVKARNALLQKRVDAAGTKDDGTLQIEALKIQIATMDINIDAVTGSSNFSLDSKQKAVSEVATIPQLEKLAKKAKELIEENDKDHKDMVRKWEIVMEGIADSAKIAASACDRKKQTEYCKDVTMSHVECSIVEEKDPVPGSCEMNALLHPYQNTIVKNYADLYLLPKNPSTKLNVGMGKLEDKMAETVSSFPVSNDSNFDWTTPLTNPYKTMAETRKKYGVLCPNSSEKDQAQDAPSEEKLMASVESFLKPLGVEGEAAAKGGKIMLERWNKDDLRIGQPGQRHVYFKNAIKSINRFIKIEKKRIALKEYERSQLVTAVKKIEKQMEESTNLASSDANCNGGFVTGGCNLNTKKPASVPTTATASSDPNCGTGFVTGACSTNTRTPASVPTPAPTPAPKDPPGRSSDPNCGTGFVTGACSNRN